MANNFISPFVSSSMSDQCLDLIEDISSDVNESSLFNDSLDEKVMDNFISRNSEVLNDSLCMEDEVTRDIDEKTAGSVVDDLSHTVLHNEALDIENMSVDTETQNESLVLETQNSTHSMSLPPSTDVPKIMPSFGKKSLVRKGTPLQRKKGKADISLCDNIQPSDNNAVTMEGDKETKVMKGDSGDSHQANEKTKLVFTAPKKCLNTTEESLRNENEKTKKSSDKLQNHNERIQLKEEKDKMKKQKRAERERQKEEKRLSMEKKKAEREQKNMEKQLKKMEREKQKSLKTRKASGKRKPEELTDVIQKVPDELRNEHKEDVDQEVPKVGSGHKEIEIEEKEMEEKVMEEKVMEMEEKELEEKEMEEKEMEMEEKEKKMEEKEIEKEEKVVEMEEKKTEEKEMEEKEMEEKEMKEKEMEEKEIEKDQSVAEEVFEDKSNGENHLHENEETETHCKVQKVIKKFSAPVKKSSMKLNKVTKNNIAETKKMASVARSTPKKHTKPALKKPIPPTATWVQCDRPDCHKWRILKGVIDPSEVPDKWYCNMNTDPDHNTCSANEEVWSDLDESMEYVYTSYTMGSLIWAKMDSYPWWPAMIDQDPDLECYHETSSNSCNPVRYHVVFFDTPVSRGWIHTLNTYPYTANSIPSDVSQVTSKYQRSLSVAMDQANLASELSIVDRIDKWGFLLRYKREKRKRKDSEGMYYKKLKLSSGLRRSSRCTNNETSYMEHDVAREEEMSSDKDDRTEMKEET